MAPQSPLVTKPAYTASFEPESIISDNSASSSCGSITVEIKGPFNPSVDKYIEIRDKKIDKNSYMSHIFYNDREIIKFPMTSRFVHTAVESVEKDLVVIGYWYTNKRPVPDWIAEQVVPYTLEYTHTWGSVPWVHDTRGYLEYSPKKNPTN